MWKLKATNTADVLKKNKTGHIMLMGLKTQYYWDANSASIDLQVQCNPSQNPRRWWCCVGGGTGRLILKYIEKEEQR